MAYWPPPPWGGFRPAAAAAAAYPGSAHGAHGALLQAPPSPWAAAPPTGAAGAAGAMGRPTDDAEPHGRADDAVADPAAAAAGGGSTAPVPRRGQAEDKPPALAPLGAGAIDELARTRLDEALGGREGRTAATRRCRPRERSGATRDARAEPGAFRPSNSDHNWHPHPEALSGPSARVGPVRRTRRCDLTRCRSARAG